MRLAALSAVLLFAAAPSAQTLDCPTGKEGCSMQVQAVGDPSFFGLSVWLNVLIGDSDAGPGVSTVVVPLDGVDLQPGDRFVSIDGAPVADARAVRRATRDVRAGDRVRLRVRRGGLAHDVTVRWPAADRLPRAVRR